MQRREKMYSWWPWKRKVSLRKEEVTAGVQSKRGRQFNVVQFKTRATCPITTPSNNASRVLASQPPRLPPRVRVPRALLALATVRLLSARAV